MLRNNLLLLLVITLSLMAATSCNNENTVIPTPQKISEVTNVTLAVLESDPPQLSIIATGKVPSTGWTNPSLAPFVYVAPPADGIYDFDFNALPPEEVSAPAVMPIEVGHIVKPMPENLKGVRVHATQNNMLAMLEDTQEPGALFEFKGSDKNDRFVIKLVEKDKIKHARDLLSGAPQEKKSVMGTIIKEKAPYNTTWSYHLSPKSITFFDMATEVCDANMAYVEENLNEVGGSFLPGNRWCPWGSELTQEIPQ